ncbi:isochorismate synthase [Longispora sp. NPDC051575]|uniref:isochorismate synthase n=1 Tax=Longispora sp. NPDC051575 TaxID=3154943 RepID=UPI0034125861
MTTLTAPGAAELLARYREGAFFFASPSGSLLTEGTHVTVPHSLRPAGLADLPGRLAAVLDLAAASGHPDPVVVGAVPFDHDAAARLVVPERVLRGGTVPAGLGLVGGDTRWTVTPVPAPESYAAAVADAVRRLRAGDLDKVVLARSLRLTSPVPVRVPGLLGALARRDPTGYSFAADLGAGRTLVGASPELLVSRRDGAVVANPLAGSAPRAVNPAEDARRARALINSEKDRHEHKVVVDAVAAALGPLCADLDVPAAPSLVRTAAMWHLSTRITGRTDRSATELAVALHPTPAVCGAPTAAARALIADLEPFDRGFYTGMVGWADARGDGEWVVTIRCGVAEGGTLTVYAGAGVVADSDPMAELAETAAKFGTLLAALGVDTALEGLSDVA